MLSKSAQSEAARVKNRTPLRPTTAVLLAVSLGLCAGYLDIGIMLLAKWFWNSDGYLRSARDFLWTVPAGHTALLSAVAVLVTAVNVCSRGRISLGAGTWLLSALAIWAALLRAPMTGLSSLVLAIGLGRLVGKVVDGRGIRPRRLAYASLGLLGILGTLAAISTGRELVQEHRAVAALPHASAGASNVILIVWDTVRAYSISSYGYDRDTTPNLTRVAQLGVQYNRALAPAPWTYPSHSCFFTGEWPYKLNSQWKFHLDESYPTLAKYLASRGYQTAGFAANTSCCSYETGLGAGSTITKIIRSRPGPF